MATAIYTRVSTAKQEEHGVSLNTQLSKLKSYCDFKDLTNLKEYTDVGTGRDTKRDGFTQMMKDIEAGRIKNVVIFRLDRLTRSVSDLNNLLQLFAEYDCGLHSATESLDTSTANGRMMVNLIGVLAQWESETISERVTVNMDSLARQGVWMSSVPYGFYLGDDKRLKIKEDEAAILREAFQLVLQGESLNNAERIIRNKHDVNWSSNYLRRKLRHATTAGNIERKGEIIRGTHEGIITEEEQKTLISIVEGNRTGRRGINRNDIFRRKVVCPVCQSIMKMNARSHNDYVKIYYSYTCGECYDNGKGVLSISESKIEESFINYFADIKFENFTLDDENKDKKDIDKINMQLKNIKDKKDKIQRAWLSDLISDDDLIKYKKELDEQERELSSTLDDVEEVETISIDQLKEFQAYFNNLYDKLDRDAKRMFIQQHIKKIHFTRTLKEGYVKRYDVLVTDVEFL